MAFRTKDAQARLDEIVTYLASQVPAPERTSVTLFVTDWLNASIMGNAQALKDLSNPMSMTDAPNAGNKADRDRRRALIVLELMKSTANINTGNAVKQMGMGQVNTRFATLLEQLRIAASETHGTGAALQAVFTTELAAHPQRFLRANRVMMANLPAATHAVFFYDYRRSSYCFDIAAPPAVRNPCRIPAVIVPAVVWDKVLGRTKSQVSGSFAGIVGTELTGATTMISTQFSGCAFCFKVVGTRIFAAHIMPDDGAGSVVTGGGAALARQLGGQVAGIAGGNFAAPGNGAGQFYVYGAGWSNLAAVPNGYPVRTAADQFMNIFGVVKGGAWRIYSQHVLDNTYTTVRIY